jgi:acyl dehydratase
MASRTKNKDKSYLDVFRLVRSMTLLAAKSANVQVIDGVYTDINDAKGLAAESAEARDSGFDGKLSIHPNQIAEINKVFTPTWEELEEASQLIAAFEANPGRGALRFKGQMVDEPHVKRAKALLARGSGVEAPDRTPAVEASKSTVPKTPHHGKWFDELPEGLIIRHALTRTVTETDNILFTTMSLNPAALHLDYAQAAATEFGRPLVNSMFTIALVVGISVLESTHGTTIANLGFDQVLFPKPLFYGDTIRVETEVISARASKSRPTQGIVTFEHRAFNQSGDLVCKARRNALMRKNPEATA